MFRGQRRKHRGKGGHRKQKTIGCCWGWKRVCRCAMHGWHGIFYKSLLHIHILHQLSMETLQHQCLFAAHGGKRVNSPTAAFVSFNVPKPLVSFKRLASCHSQPKSCHVWSMWLGKTPLLLISQAVAQIDARPKRDPVSLENVSLRSTKPTFVGWPLHAACFWITYLRFIFQKLFSFTNSAKKQTVT